MRDIAMNDTNSTNDVVIIGDALMDYQYWVEDFPKAGEDIKILSASKNCGGSSSNSAIALGYLGVSCAFCGRIGRDESGSEILRQMQSVGLNTTCMQYGNSTGYTLTIIDKNAERTMFSYRGAAGEPFQLTNELNFYLKHAKLLLLSGYLLKDRRQAEFILKAARIIKQAGGMVALDASPNIHLADKITLEQMLVLTDILLPNKQELKILSGVDDIQQALETLISVTPCIAVKLGSKGSVMMIKEGFKTISGRPQLKREQFFVPAVEAIPVDTTGAGDAFNAGFIHSFLKNEKPESWLASGNLIAGKVIMEKGAASLYNKSHFNL
jgi:ribokinase